MSDWIDVGEYMLNLNYGQLMYSKKPKGLKRIKESQEELPKRLVAPGRFMVSSFFSFPKYSIENLCFNKAIFMWQNGYFQEGITQVKGTITLWSSD